MDTYACVYNKAKCLNTCLFICTQHKQNKHQFSWLWNKVLLKDGAKGSMQEFLDNNQYNRAGILMYERVFGQGFVSPGGMTTTKVMLAPNVFVCEFCFQNRREVRFKTLNRSTCEFVSISLPSLISNSLTQIAFSSKECKYFRCQ